MFFLFQVSLDDPSRWMGDRFDNMNVQCWGWYTLVNSGLHTLWVLESCAFMRNGLQYDGVVFCRFFNSNNWLSLLCTVISMVCRCGMLRVTLRALPIHVAAAIGTSDATRLGPVRHLSPCILIFPHSTILNAYYPWWFVTGAALSVMPRWHSPGDICSFFAHVLRFEKYVCPGPWLWRSIPAYACLRLQRSCGGHLAPNAKMYANTELTSTSRADCHTDHRLVSTVHGY